MSEVVPEGGPREDGRSGNRKRWLIVAITAAVLIVTGWYLYVALGLGSEGCACVQPKPSVTTTTTA